MFLWQDFVSDRCYLFFHLFSSIVDFFENYAMREIEGLSLFSSRGGGGGGGLPYETDGDARRLA